jgi:hypothetical protein
MPFNKIPRSFFGVDYSNVTGASAGITFGIKDRSTGTAAATFSAAPVAGVITTLATHNLKPGDAVKFSVAATNISTSVVYFVKTVSETTLGAGFNRLTVALTPTGADILVGTPGSTCTITAMGLLYDLENAEVDAAGTGDWRRIISGLMEMLYRRWLGVPTADRPSKVTVSRSSTVDPTSLEVVLTYTVRVVNAPAPLEVADEPVA